MSAITVCPHCQAKLKFATSVAGKKIRCPRCKEAFAVPADGEERTSPVGKSGTVVPEAVSKPADDVEDADDQEEPGRRRPSRSRDDDESRSKSKASRRRDDVDDDDDRPLRGKDKKSKGNPLLLWGLVGGGVAAVLVIGGIIGAVVILNSGKGSSSSSPDGPPFAGRGSTPGGRGPSGWMSSSDAVGVPSSASPEPLAKPDVTMTADEWHREWKDAEGAKKKYMGKIIELTGTIQMAIEVESIPDNIGLVVFKIEGQTFGLRCATRDKMDWLKVSEGSTARIRGKVAVFGDPGDLLEAQIIEAGPNPAPVLAAKQLAADYATDKAETFAKYKLKYLYVEGEVIDKTALDLNRGSIRLNGQGNFIVRCYFASAIKNRFEALKPGSRVKILGTLTDYGEKNEVLLLCHGLAVGPATDSN